MSEYKPIQCELHDGYELACMRKLIAEVIWRDDSGHIHREKLRYLDIEILRGEEFLIADNREGQQRRLRLDRIESMPPSR